MSTLPLICQGLCKLELLGALVAITWRDLCLRTKQNDENRTRRGRGFPNGIFEALDLCLKLITFYTSQECQIRSQLFFSLSSLLLFISDVHSLVLGASKVIKVIREMETALQLLILWRQWGIRVFKTKEEKELTGVNTYVEGQPGHQGLWS